MSLTDLDIKNEYRSLIDSMAQDFYIPVLKESTLYQRASGFFSSSVLVQISKGLNGLIANGGKMQLVASPVLSEDDIAAIKTGYESRKAIIESALLRQLHEHTDYYEAERLNLLANLIADGHLDIKIAITTNESNIGIYHEKMGIMTDAQGNCVAFSGSMNETGAGLSLNYESIDVFCDWEGESEKAHVRAKQNAFQAIWNNCEPNIEVIEFPELNDTIIKKYKRSPPETDIDHVQFPNAYRKGKPKAYGARIPATVSLHDYQKEAILSWQAHDYRGIFDMATGTGKTFTGLGGIAMLSEAIGDKLAVFIVCPFQHLVEQWVEDIRVFGMEPIIGYSAPARKGWKDRLKKAVRDQKIRADKPFFCFVTTNETFSSQFVQDQIDKIVFPILLVVDEAHNFGAQSLSCLLDERFKYRLALSATLDRHRDEEGTKALYDFFGEKCIVYTLERAIKEEKLTPYKYYPIVVCLTEEELADYERLSYEMSRHLIKGKNGKIKLDRYGEILAIKRSRVVAAATLKLDHLRKEIIPYKDEHFILVYCGATTVTSSGILSPEDDTGEMKQVEAVTRILGNELGMKVSKFTAEENMDTRNSIKQHFKNGDDLQAIVAIKCLDEGVNIPGIRTAFILASTTNPKEYIQRRGRVLRTSPETGKKFAEIYDFVTLPRPLDEVSGLTEEQMKRDLSLVNNELTRLREFSSLSMNSMESMNIIWEICDCYHLPYEPTEQSEED